MENGGGDEKKNEAASLLRRLIVLWEQGGTLEDWNESFAPLVADVADQLAAKLGADMRRWVPSAAASAMSTVLKRVPIIGEGDALPVQPVGPNALLGLLVLIAFDKAYEKKRRDDNLVVPVEGALALEEAEEERLVAEGVRKEMEQQLKTLLEGLDVLGHRPTRTAGARRGSASGTKPTRARKMLVYRHLIEKELGLSDIDYRDIPQETGVSEHTVKMARRVLEN